VYIFIARGYIAVTFPSHLVIMLSEGNTFNPPYNNPDNKGSRSVDNVKVGILNV
jgi:hypothetical protein